MLDLISFSISVLIWSIEAVAGTRTFSSTKTAMYLAEIPLPIL